MIEPPKALVRKAVQAACAYRDTIGMPIKTQQRFRDRMRKAYDRVVKATQAQGPEVLMVYENLNDLAARAPACRLRPGKDY